MPPVRRAPTQDFSKYDDMYDPRANAGPVDSPGAIGPQSPVPEPPGPMPQDPQLPDDVIIGGRGGETPRERADVAGMGSPGGMTGGMPTPRMPMVPTPQAGAPGPSVNPPMPQLMGPRQRLLGGSGGLTGGGLGVPFDPTSNQKSDPISSLMELLGKKGLGGY